MPKLPNARPGTEMKVLQRPLNFSFWPMRKDSKRYGLQSLLFSSDPWIIIRSCINKNKDTRLKNLALSFLEQAEDYFNAFTSAGIYAAKPVLQYYCFLNLVKAYIIHKGIKQDLGKAMHGLSENIKPGGKELTGAFLEAYPSTSGVINIYDEFVFSVTQAHLSGKKQYSIPHLMPQVLQGHRIWSSIKKEKERFIQIEKIEFYHNENSKDLWLCIFLFADDLTRLAISRRTFLQDTSLASEFEEVECDKAVNDRVLHCFQQKSVKKYAQRSADVVMPLVASVRHKLWKNILSVPPYRKYYVYMSPATESGDRLSQLLSIYCIFYYLGSVTRYRPYVFDTIQKGEYGAHIQEILANLPNQFIYLMASEFAQQEVTRAAII